MKVSKKKKTLPVEIDWGSGMRDRLRYISPGEEELIRRNRSTDAERYYGGIRAYPDPGDTAAGDSLGVTSGTTTGTTVSNGGTSGGSDAGSSTGGGSDSGNAVGSSMGGTTSGTVAGGVGGTAGGEAGAVTSSAMADTSYRGSTIGGVGSAEGALKGTEDSYRNGGIGSLDNGRITSQTPVSDSRYAENQNSAASYSTNNTPSPVTAGPVTSSLYGDDVPDEAVPGSNVTQPENQHVTAAESLRGMLTRGGAYVGPTGGIVGSTATLAQASDGTYGTPSTMASEATLDRLATGNSVIGNTEADGKRTPKIADRVPGGVNDLGDDTDTGRGVSTVADAEGIPKPQVALGISSPIPQAGGITALPDTPGYPQRTVSLPNTQQGMVSPDNVPTVSGGPYTSPQMYGDRTISLPNTAQGMVSPDAPGERVISVETLPDVPSPTQQKQFYDRVPQDANYTKPSTKQITDRIPPSDEMGAQRWSEIVAGPPSPAGDVGVPPGVRPASDLSGFYSTAAIDERNRRMEAASRGAGIDSLATQPRDYEANADVYSEGGVDTLPSQDERAAPSQEGDNADEKLSSEQEARRDADVKRGTNVVKYGTRVGQFAGGIPGLGTAGNQFAKWYDKSVKQKLDAYVSANPSEKMRMEAENPELVGWSERLGLETSGVYGPEHYDNWAQEAGMRGQGGREGGSGNNNIVVDDPTGRAVSQYNDWINGRNIPDKNDPDYPAYMYFVSKLGIERQGSGGNWGNGWGNGWDNSDSEWGWS